MNDHRANYLLVIKEEDSNGSGGGMKGKGRADGGGAGSSGSSSGGGGGGAVEYGVCFIDAATGEFNLGQFVDDNERNQLETLLLRVKPREVLYEKVKTH